jgi:IS1 family transposase
VIINKLNPERRAQIVRVLCEGNSIRSTARITGAAINTVVSLLVDLGSACSEYQDRSMRNLPCKRLQCDEIWSFCYAKTKNVPEEVQGQFGYGDVWTWTAVCADTKLNPCWLVGERGGADAVTFIDDLASRLASRVQLTTDGHKPYLEAIEGAFGADIDYAMLIKLYGQPDSESQRRYSPARCIGTEKRRITGQPDASHINTSYVERQNLSMRMGMRRFTRLTNAFSKKLENHMHAIALYFMHYNYARPHTTLSKQYPTTPAMAAGLTDHVWTAPEIVALLDDRPNSN